MKAKRLTKAERYLLLHMGPDFNYYRCPQHGVIVQPKTSGNQGKCWRSCTCPVEVVVDPVALAYSK